MTQKFYPDVSSEKRDKFVENIQNYNVSMAKLQGYFVQCGDNFNDALSNVRSLEILDNASHSTRSSGGIPSDADCSSGSDSTVILPVSKKRPMTSRRTLTAQEIDKMVFNPQEGWDKDIRDDLTPK